MNYIESIPINEGPKDTQLLHSKHKMIPPHHYEIEEKSPMCAPLNHEVDY